MTVAQFSIEAEQAVLGSCLRSNDLIDLFAAEIAPELFYDPMHARIWSAMLGLRLSGQVTVLTLWEVLKTDPGLADDEIGGQSYLAALASASPVAPAVKDLTGILREYAARRELLGISADLVQFAAESPSERPAQSIADAAMERLLAITHSKRVILSPYESAMASLRQIEAVHSGKPIPSISTGLASLDEKTGGLQGGDLCVVMAGPGMGKSSLLASFALRAALKGHPSLFFSLEMTQQQVVERMLCDLDFDTADRPMWYSQFRNARLNADEFARAGAAAQILGSIPLEINDTESLTIQQIANHSRAFKAKHGGKRGIILIDYFQIVAARERRDGSREEEVAETAKGAKSLAKHLDWPVCGGAQINEGPQVAPGKERPPTLVSVRESKAIIHAADIVLSPWREAYYVQRQKPRGALEGDQALDDWRHDMAACRHKMDLLGLKNRHGGTFEIELYCDMASSAVRDNAPLRSQLDGDSLKF